MSKDSKATNIDNHVTPKYVYICIDDNTQYDTLSDCIDYMKRNNLGSYKPKRTKEDATLCTK